MLLDRLANDLDLALFVLNQVDRLYVVGGQNQIDTSIKALVGPTWNSILRPSIGNQPAWYAGTGMGYSVMIGGGTENYLQGQTLMDGYTNRVGDPRHGDVNTYLVYLTNVLSGWPMYADLLNAPTFIGGGHSLGGAWTTLLTLLAYQQQPRETVKSITFGAPRSGGRRWEIQFRNIPSARWMNDNDPVPLVPPTIEQVPLLAVGTGIDLLLAYANQHHVEGGLQLDNMGVITAQELPTLAAIAPTTNLASWLVSLVNNTASAHNTAEYRRRLTLANVTPLPHSAGMPPPAPGEVFPPVPITEVRKERRAAVSSIVGSGEAQGEGPILIPKAKIFSTRKYGSTWYTTLGGVPFAVGPRRRRAGLLAQEGNAFIRRLLRQAAVDPTTLEQQLDLFLLSAQDPTSGIRPQLAIAPV